MKLKIIKQIVFLISISTVLSSCDFFGLEYQYNYKNTSAPIDLELHMTAYEFIKTRKSVDLYLLYQAIEKAGMKEYFESQNKTYFLLTDPEFAKWMSTQKYASINSIPNAVISQFLKGYTLTGIYNSYNLTKAGKDVLADDGTRVLKVQLRDGTDTQNQFGVQVGLVKTTGLPTMRTVYTSNLKPTNGYIHILILQLN